MMARFGALPKDFGEKGTMSRKYDVMAIGVIFLVCILVNWAGYTAPGMWWTDESRHAMDGVFFHDLFVDLPLTHAYDYAMEYFARYPALALNWYPPAFSVVLGICMQFFGVSEVTAHGTVLAFWLVGLVAWYAWCARTVGRLVAFFSSLMLVLAPEVVLWSRSVMLEAPAVAMLAVSLLAFERYLEHPGHGRAFLAGAALAFTLLLKQSTVFAVPAFLAYAWLSGRGATLWRRQSIVAWLLVALALAFLALHAIKFGGTGMAATAGNLHEAGGSPPRWSLARWLLYWKVLYSSVGIAPLGAALIGTFLFLRGPRHRAGYLVLAWIVSWYLMVTILFGVPDNAPRYTAYAMPALAWLAAYGLAWFPARSLPFGALAGALFLWAGWQVVYQLGMPHRFVGGYEAVAQRISKLPNSGAILFAGKHDGNFIFHLRALDPARQRVILRGDKLLVSMSIHKYFGVKSRVASTDEIDAMLDNNAVRWVVVESRDLVGLKEFAMLHQALQLPGYRLVSELPVVSNLPEFANLSVRIYENLDLRLPEDGHAVIDYPYFGRSFRFTFPDTNPVKQPRGE